MSTYPSYPDFGKSTKDFFTKGFQTGNFKLNFRDAVSKHINATLTGAHHLEKKEANGDFQVKLTCPVMPGYSATTKWTTGNVLTQEILAANLKGFDAGVKGDYNFDSSSITGKLLGAYRHPRFTLDTSYETKDGENHLVDASLVTGFQDFATGYQFQIDPKEGIIKKNNVAASYVTGPVKFHATLDNAELVWAGIIYKVNPWLETGVTATYKSDPEGYYVFGSVVKYMMDCCTAVKAKFDSDLQCAIGFETKIRKTSTITMSLQLDGNKINEGGHQVGLSFDLEV